MQDHQGGDFLGKEQTGILPIICTRTITGHPEVFDEIIKGCHLVVDSNQLNEKIIRICANTAAYYSQGRYSSSVPVDYCEIRNVKKIKGARPGCVSYKNYKTIYIDPYDDKELTVTTI